MIQRMVNPLEQKSFFLFGARGTGKTTYLKSKFSEDQTLYIDLLDIDLFDQLMLDPSRLRAIIHQSAHLGKRVVIDEVQKLPQLLDLVHSEIQKNKRQFILTGSSSRRLKQKGSNLLAGRAWVYNLFPFSTLELGDAFQLKQVLEQGSLPDAILASNKLDAREYLNAYTFTYLEKEIQQEQWVKKIAPFRRFLSVASQMNGKIINKSKIARDVGVDDVTVANYFEIVEDTLLGITLPAFHRSVRKSQKQAPKFYLIDPGIKRALDRTLTVELLPQTSAWGEAFEHWVILEFIKNASYRRYDWDFSYIRTKEDVEIDLIIRRPGAPALMVEIKSKDRVTEADAKSLLTLGNDIDQKAEKWLLSNDPVHRKMGSAHALFWIDALKRLFQ